MCHEDALILLLNHFKRLPLQHVRLCFISVSSCEIKTN